MAETLLKLTLNTNLVEDINQYILFTPGYSWNNVKLGVKHKSINQTNLVHTFHTGRNVKSQ